MAFYIGCYLILSDTIDPKHDHDGWELPDIYGHQGHMADTSNVEELLIDPEDMDLIPTQIQFGCATYTADDGFTPLDLFAEFYTRDEKFYVRGFTPTSYWAEFYTSADTFTEFYMANEAFYVRGFTPTSYWAEFYMAADSFTEFYIVSESFYVRNFTPTDYWTEFYVKC